MSFQYLEVLLILLSDDAGHMANVFEFLTNYADRPCLILSLLRWNSLFSTQAMFEADAHNSNISSVLFVMKLLTLSLEEVRKEQRDLRNTMLFETNVVKKEALTQEDRLFSSPSIRPLFLRTPAA